MQSHVDVTMLWKDLEKPSRCLYPFNDKITQWSRQSSKQFFSDLTVMSRATSIVCAISLSQMSHHGYMMVKVRKQSSLFVCSFLKY